MLFKKFRLILKIGFGKNKFSVKEKRCFAVISIGEKLRNLRLRNNLTQAELADRCELSKGFISQLESDQTSPSLSTLEDILLSLGTNFRDFFNEAAEKIVYGEQDVCVKEFDGYSIDWLVTDSQKNDMEPIIVELESGSETAEDNPHSGEEFGYVLAGNIVLVLGDEKFRVKKGESFYFKASKPHKILNTGKLAARVIWITTPPNF